MALLGHDLRAAVSDVIGGLRLIGQDGFDDDTRIQFERIRAAGEGLARLLEEGLSMMLGEEDFVATHPANVQLERLFYDTEMRWSGRAREKGLDFRMTVAPDVPRALALDRVALERILSNTLSNAMKYADSGVVGLDVHMAGNGALRLEVTDQGPGFSADAMARLFEYGGRPAGLAKPGSGLGMHITRSMARRMGGQINVENRPEGGARVTLDLPPDSWTIGEAPMAEPVIADLGPYRILVAEDNATNRAIIGHMLDRLGSHYEIAEDGVEALVRLGRETFDLALIDIEMPRLTGLEVIRTLRGGVSANRDLPVIAITAYVLRSNRDAIYAAGANSILAKPLAGIETFGNAIISVLNRQQVDLADIPRDEAAGRAGVPYAGLDRLLATAGPEMARELLDRLSSDLRTAERELIGGLATGDIAAIRACSHVLIALAGAVGAAMLLTLVTALNAAAHRKDTSAFARLGRDALTHLDRLISHVTHEKIRRGEGR